MTSRKGTEPNTTTVRADKSLRWEGLGGGDPAQVPPTLRPPHQLKYQQPDGGNAKEWSSKKSTHVNKAAPEQARVQSPAPGPTQPGPGLPARVIFGPLAVR